MKPTNKLIRYSILFLFIYSLWGFLLTKTIFASSNVSLIVLVCLFCLFGGCFLKYAKASTLQHIEVCLWIPYLLYTCHGYIVQGQIQLAICWFVPIVVLLLSYHTALIHSIPRKLLVYSAIVSAVGVFSQFLYPPLQSVVSSIYITESIDKWAENNTGYAGFTYQLAQTAALIICAMPFILYFKIYDHRYKKLRLLFFLFIGLFLAGKRSFSIISIIIPIFIYFWYSNTHKRLTFLLSSFLLLALVISITSFDIKDLSSIPGLSRFSDSYTDYQAGEDITSGRSEIWEDAFSLYEKNPVWGIGVGRFAQTVDDVAVHNTYLAVLCEQGIVGFCLFVLPLMVCLCSTLSILRFKKTTPENFKWIKMSLYIQLLYILYSLTGNTNYNLYGYQFYFIAVSIFVYIKYYTYEDLNIRSQLN